jgi:uncharacterized YkwD family protein
MKKKIVILLALSLLFTATASFAASGTQQTKAIVALEKVDIDDATVTASILNIRQGPSTSYPSICKLEKGQTVKIIGKLGDWYAVYNTKDGCIGAVDGKYLNTSEAVTVSASASKAASKTTSAADKDEVAAAPTVPADVTDDELTLFNLVNKARKDAGVKELAFDKELLKIARLKATDMVDNKYFSHQSPTYGSPFDMMKQFDFTFKTAGENIAGNQSIDGAFKAWMSSETHKKNILNSSFNYTGIGITSSTTYGKILVQQFIGK